MVFVPPLATSLNELKSRITAAVNSLDKDTLRVFGTSSMIILMLFMQQVEST